MRIWIRNSRKTPDEGWRIQRPKCCDKIENQDEDTNTFNINRVNSVNNLLISSFYIVVIVASVISL